MKVSAQLEVLFMLLAEEVVRDGLGVRLRNLEELFVALILRDEVCLQASAEGLVFLMFSTEAFQCR